jgi:hypothetical protein
MSFSKDSAKVKAAKSDRRRVADACGKKIGISYKTAQLMIDNVGDINRVIPHDIGHTAVLLHPEDVPSHLVLFYNFLCIY